MLGRIAVVVGVGAAVVVLAGGTPGAQAPLSAPPTFTKDVAPIFFANCVSCHRPGEIAPMSLLTYEDARPYARSIRTRVENGIMPPWHADAPAGTFRNDRRLPEADKDTIIRWADSGAPKGDPKDLPSAPTFAAGWTIGTPDVVLTMDHEFAVPASGEVAYQYFEIPTNFTEDKWVQALEIRPGATRVVHHVLAFAREPDGAPRSPIFTVKAIDPPAAPRADQAERLARAAAAAGARPRPTSAAGRGVLIATTAPGTNAQVFRAGQAMLIKAGSLITLQIHYTANGTATNDRSSIGFVFAKQPPQQEVRSGSFTNTTFAIPPETRDYQVRAAIEFNRSVHVLSLFPHTHLRGTSWQYRLVHPDGRAEVVLTVPKYDFNWQTYYEFMKPLEVPQGARLEATALYDNSTANKWNPDPKSEVRWGEQTWEEMHYSGITYIVDEPAVTVAGRR